MISDKIARLLNMWLVIIFVICCIIDVTKVYPLMDNLAVLLIIALGFGFNILNIIITNTSKENSEIENLPEPEDESSELRQI